MMVHLRPNALAAAWMRCIRLMPCLMLVMASPVLLGAASPKAPAASLIVELKPRPERPGGETIAELDVVLRFTGLMIPGGAPIARIALVSDNVDTIATTLTGLAVSDRSGQIVLARRDIDLPVEDARDSEAGGPTREWIAGRPTSGPTIIRYTVPARATLSPRGPTGPLEFRNDDAGMSVAGNIFLLMPPGEQRYKTQVKWDLSALPRGARGISSLGEGKASDMLSSSELRMSYFMAGKIGGWPDPAPARTFFSAWQGKPPFDAEALMKWTNALHGHYQHFFGRTKSAPYGVFLRYNPVNPGGGTGFFRSFVTTYGSAKGSDLDELKITLAHEMFHTFQPFITKPAGKASSWFGEGLAVYYEGVLPLRYGLISPEDYIKDVNFSASRYYSSIMAALPNAAIADGFWKDTRIRTLAYDRGMLYFATVDEAVRQSSANRKTLDDLMLAMLHRQQAQGSLSNADWEAVLQQYIGAQAVLDFHSFLGGKIPLPGSGAFGPCFGRTRAKAARYELGFEPAVLSEQRRIVRGLIAGSAADRAGLRDGDEITKPVPQDQIQGEQTALLHLDVSRAGRKLHIAYAPRGEMVDIYQWVRQPSMPATECAF